MCGGLSSSIHKKPNDKLNGKINIWHLCEMVIIMNSWVMPKGVFREVTVTFDNHILIKLASSQSECLCQI